MKKVDGRAKRGKLTPKVSKRICKALEDGKTWENAFRHGGIHPDTGFRWKSKGAKAKRGKYKSFYEALIASWDKSEQALLDTIAQASKKDWRAARDLLKIRWPEKYNPKQRHEHSVSPDTPVTIQIEMISDWKPK